MAKFVLCWHKPSEVEEVESPRVDKTWYGHIAWGRLDVLKIKDDKAFKLGSAGGWSRVPKKAAEEASDL
jgi:hypothetical protein